MIRLRIYLVVYLVIGHGGLIAQQVSGVTIEPPFWWTGMKHNTLQLLVHGVDIGNTTVEINYPGIEISKVHQAANKNFLFIDLSFDSVLKPGQFIINFQKNNKTIIQHSYSLKQREANQTRSGINQRDVIYLITPDRFVNGDTGNDEVKNLSDKKDRTFHSGRHGGDIAGLISAVDYIDKLGATAVWVNPVLENNMPGYSYHGYATTDYYSIDARFGSNELYKKFSATLHSRNMKLIMDMVLNHCGREHWWMKDMPFQNWINYSQKPVMTNHAISSLSDPHATQSDKVQMEKGWFVSAMPDLNHDNPFMANYLIQNSMWWIEFAGLDGIRVDTYPYNKKEFMDAWANYIHTEYPAVYLVGETWVDNEAQEAYWARPENNTATNGMTDFPLCMAIHKAFDKNGDVTSLYQVISKDFLYHSPNSNMIFTDNHDMDRIFYTLRKDVDKLKLALTFLLTTRGIPQLYYGTELGMSGHGNHGVIREDFPGGWATDKRNAFITEGRSARENEIFNHVQKLLNWRKKNEAIQTGILKHFVPYENLYVYNRKSDTESIVVIINNTDKSKKMDMTRYAEILDGYESATDVLTAKKITNLREIDVNANTALILNLIQQQKVKAENKN